MLLFFGEDYSAVVFRLRSCRALAVLVSRCLTLNKIDATLKVNVRVVRL